MQGGSAAFFAPMFAILDLPEYSCNVGSGTCHDTQTYMHAHIFASMRTREDDP